MLLRWAGGKKRADEVMLGDLLWTRDEDDPDGPLELKRVQAVFVRLAPIWHVELADGQVLRTTMEHPFWVENRRSWQAVYELREGNLLRTEDGRLVAVSSVQDTGVWERVYNWEVEDCHTYFVSATLDADSIWAHNAGCKGGRAESGKKAGASRAGLGEDPRFGAGYEAIFGNRTAPASNRLRAGDAGSYDELAGRGVAGDGLTPHHMPQAARGFTRYGQGGALALPHGEHVQTRTYGTRGAITAAAEAGLPFRSTLARDIQDIRRIAGNRYNQGLLDLIQYYRNNFPNLMAK
jgi:hypothetical protein